MARPEKVGSALLDTSAVLGIVTGDPAFACLRSLLAAVDRGEVVLVESTAILVEVRPHHPGDGDENARARDAMLGLLQSRRTRLVDVSLPVARKAGQLAADLNMTAWDAVHLATAVLAEADVLVVRDGGFPKGDFEGVWVTGPFDIDDDKIPGLLAP